MKILVTGAAGFIGFHTCKKLLEMEHEVIGIDNMDPYYDIKLKEKRLEQLEKYINFQSATIDINNTVQIERLFEVKKFDYVINLAAQAGVRYSIENPKVYVDTNISGFLKILEGCKNTNVKHLVYASSSSVYGNNTKYPFSIKDNVDTPISMYAATKKSNELMSHVYSHLFNLNVTGLRFFTVYGPWGRPDMALFKFTKNIFENKKIDVYNNGDMYRDFTYIDDIVDGVVKVVEKPNGYKLYNIGNNKCESLMRYIEVLEEKIDKKADINFMPMQDGDVKKTYADIDDMVNDFGYKPSTNIETGISNFVDWYKEYYGV